MGEVYRADDLKLDQEIALKFLPAAAVKDADMRARLLNEVRAARQVSHPNVCRVYDVVEVEGEHFLSMELIEGENLASVMKRTGRPSRETALAIARQLCAGLASAHERGVLHRDLKPSNVMIDDRGVARITDFGLAEIGAAVSGAKAREGSPHYMAPEQLEGKEATVQSEIYALGLVLYEIFTGQPARTGATMREIVRAAAASPPIPSTLAPDIDPAVERAILACLDHDPTRRPSTAVAVARALPGGASLTAALAAAQQRADRISAFRAELSELRQAGVLRLDDAESLTVERYHEGVLRDLVRLYDVDVSERGRSLSLGMRVVSVLGSLAFAIGVVFLYLRFWGVMSVPVQVAILAAAPIVALVATDTLARRETSGYFATIAALFAFTCALLNTVVIGLLFNMSSSPFAFLGLGAFGLTVAYGWRLRLPLVAGLLATGIAVGGWLTSFSGVAWFLMLQRPESLIPVGALLAATPVIARHIEYPGFPQIYRSIGFAILFLPLTVLASFGAMSLLPFEPRVLEIAYQLVGFAAMGWTVWIGVRRPWKEAVYIGSAYFIVMLYVRLFDWWWDWMPRYAFFFVVGLLSLVVLFFLKRLRAAVVAGVRRTAP